MPTQYEQTQIDIDKIKNQVKVLERISIQENFDPTTYLYLLKVVNFAVATLPTQTYSSSAPTGTAVTGSVWFEDTGVLATRKIHVYSGSAWIQMK